MEQADGGGAWLDEAAARCTGWRRRQRGAPAGGEATHRVEERRRDEWRRGGAALQERPHDYIRALQSANPKTLYARKAAKAPTLKRFCGIRGGNWTPWRRHTHLRRGESDALNPASPGRLGDAIITLSTCEP
jgi:hypothetical protein